MMAGTHIAVAIACGQLTGASGEVLALLSLGSILPDIDHPRANISRIFPWIALPLHSRFGHRRTIHGFTLWLVITLFGLWFEPLLFIGLGGLTHLSLDLFNTSGVQALMPWAEHSCVMFERKWRFSVGSRKELVVLALALIVAWIGAYVETLGGIQTLLGIITKAPKIAYYQYKQAGTQISFFEGTLRHRDGRLEAGGRWLVVGQEGGRGFAIWDEGCKRLIHTPRDAEFLRAYLKKTDKSWKTLELTGWARTKREAFFYDGKLWRHAAAGSIVFGWVIGRELEMETIGVE